MSILLYNSPTLVSNLLIFAILLKIITIEISNILKYQHVTFDLSPKRIITNLVQIIKTEKVEHETENREYDTHTEKVELIPQWRIYRLVPIVAFFCQQNKSQDYKLSHYWPHCSGCNMII